MVATGGLTVLTTGWKDRLLSASGTIQYLRRATLRHFNMHEKFTPSLLTGTSLSQTSPIS